MDPTGREQHQLCTTLNVKRFMENFLDEQKGKGPYVDALSKKENYSPIFPAKLDSVELPGDTPHDNGERLYVYVTPEESQDDEGNTITIYKWRANGQADLLSDIQKAKLQDLKHQEKRDQVLSKLLSLMSPESSLAGNMGE